VVLVGCTPSRRLTESQVLAVAETAMKERFPQDFEAHRPYHAELKKDGWYVRGTLPTNTLGGTPEALVDGDSGKLLKVWHTQ